MIQPITLGNLWALRHKPRSLVMLYTEPLLVRPHHVLWFAMRSLVEAGGRESLTLGYRDRGLRAIVQAVGRSGRPELDVVALASYGALFRGMPTDPDVWFRLLEQVCVSAGHAGVQRVYAALSQRHEELRELFRQLGFGCYSQQTVLRLEGPDWDQGTTIAPLRPQLRRDVWAIQKLYGVVTPHPVQHAEVRSALDWQLPLAQSLRHPARRSWVLGASDHLTAYLQLQSGPSGHLFTMLVHPELRDQTTDILRFGLGQINGTLPIYLLLRSYQQELLLPASDLGFQPIGEQALLVKHTTVPARRFSLVPALEPGAEPRAPIPTITPLSEDTSQYVGTTRYHQQH
jgi:hypothetical protein